MNFIKNLFLSFFFLLIFLQSMYNDVDDSDDEEGYTDEDDESWETSKGKTAEKRRYLRLRLLHLVYNLWRSDKTNSIIPQECIKSSELFVSCDHQTTSPACSEFHKRRDIHNLFLALPWYIFLHSWQNLNSTLI